MKNLFHSLWGVSRLLVGGMTIALASCTQDSGLLDDFSEASEVQFYQDPFLLLIL